MHISCLRSVLFYAFVINKENHEGQLERRCLILLCTLSRRTATVAPSLMSLTAAVVPKFGFNPFAILHIVFDLPERLGYIPWTIFMMLQTISVWLFYESLGCIIIFTVIGNFNLGFVSLKEGVTQLEQYANIFFIRNIC